MSFSENHTGESSRETISNIDANDLDEETIQKLRGDAIGDTLFSQSFVLKTMLKFDVLTWDDKFEEDLCFLWDMTVEKDVCMYLLEINFPSIVCKAVLDNNHNNRFIEIVVGILANIFCSDCDNVMTTEQLDIILSICHSDDPLILIQLMRFISASTKSSKLLFALVTESLFEQMCFILKSSTNDELLLKTLEAMAKLTTDLKIKEHLINFGVYESVLIGYKTIFQNNPFEPDTNEKQLCIKYMLENITNICAYINKYSKRDILSDIQSSSNVFSIEIMKILKFFSNEENLMPISQNFIFYMSAINYIVSYIGIKYIPELFLSVTKILGHVIDIKNEEMELFDSTLELECYLISVTSQENIERDFKLLSRQLVKKVIHVINENLWRFGLNTYISISTMNYYNEYEEL